MLLAAASDKRTMVNRGGEVTIIIIEPFRGRGVAGVELLFVGSTLLITISV